METVPLVMLVGVFVASGYAFGGYFFIIVMGIRRSILVAGRAIP